MYEVERCSRMIHIITSAQKITERIQRILTRSRHLYTAETAAESAL